MLTADRGQSVHISYMEMRGEEGNGGTKHTCLWAYYVEGPYCVLESVWSKSRCALCP